MYEIELTIGGQYRERLLQAERERLARRVYAARRQAREQEPRRSPLPTVNHQPARPNPA